MSARSWFDSNVQRYVDEELLAPERQRFEGELAVNNELRAAVDELSALRNCFAPERGAVIVPAAAGFSGRVVAEVHRVALPDLEPARRFAVWSRRLTIAAVFVFALALLVVIGLLRGSDSGRLQASPAEVEQILDELDASIRAAGATRAPETRK